MQKQLWEFINEHGDFLFQSPEKIGRLYFPLVNEAEFMSSITPLLKGDIKSSQSHFLLQPVTTKDLYSNESNRNFWIYINSDNIESITAVPKHSCANEEIILNAGMLWHRISRKCDKLGLKSEITNFVPVSGEHIEIMMVKITNISASPITFTPTSAIPIFGRSADNLRDHRHVSSLLHRIRLLPHGIIVKPVMSFDERGHKINHVSYYVLGCEQDATAPVGTFPTIRDFIGEGGNLTAPKAVLENLLALKKINPIHQGKEAIGALRFNIKTLNPGESATYILMLGIMEKDENLSKIFKKFNSKEKTEHALKENIEYWKKKIDSINFFTANQTFDNWLRWVMLQPILRKIYGCSFLPDFDYGRGGKGWRDLWQDCLTFIFAHPRLSRKILSVNFSGIRIDGTNATIITKKPGYFIADRNKITRVWMDHGIWPFFTLQHYIHQTGDLNILFEKHTYFYDRQLSRGKETDFNWNQHQKYCKHLRTKDGRIYKGTILEHILIQHLVQFFNVGKHNNIRLEDADWNDGLDMAKEKGESVAFSCFYASNLKDITILLEKLRNQKIHNSITIAKEILILLDSLHKNPLNYDDADKKNALLQRYFKAVKFRISGKKTAIKTSDLIKDLSRKWQWMFDHIQTNEWINFNKNMGFFNGYYDNKSKRVEGKNNGILKMTLTGQVFPIMSGIASQNQITQIFKTANKYLKDKKLGGYRLNTNFKKPQFDLGRAFAFAYGEKENGAIFSHMCVMFAYALYKRGFVNEGFEVLESLFNLATNSAVSKIYPCLPEYFNLEGRGMYCYLTGSASWFIMTILTEVFGIKGHFGDLIIAPKLVRKLFKTSDNISVSCYFAERRINFIFKNPQKLNFDKYTISEIKTTPQNITFSHICEKEILIKRKSLLVFPENSSITIEITLN